MTVRSLTTRGIVEALVADLRERILAGEYAPGDRLPERELTDTYRVARHTVRAALRELAAERLIRLVANRGAHVSVLDADELSGLYELRAALETEALRLLAERYGFDPWPPGIIAAADRLENVCTAEPVDRGAVDDAHADFHYALVAAAGSDRITEAHAALDAETRVYLLQLRPLLSPGEMAAGHRQLLAELRVDGPDAVRRHVASATELARRAGLTGADRHP